MGVGFNDCVLCVEHACRLKSVCSKCFSTSKRLCWTCGKCRASCDKYVSYHCPDLSKAPYVCNGCKKKHNCSLEKSVYCASLAQKEYEKTLSESRSGFAISREELARLDSLVSPLLKNGQSIHHISIHHADELLTCDKSLYNYVHSGLFSARNIDMPRVVRLKPRKSSKKSFKVDKSCRDGRTWDDYLSYIQGHPDAAICEMDSVEGIKGRKVLLTLHFVKLELQLAFLRDANDSQSVIDIFENLYRKLRPDVFVLLFQVILTDNGSEFSNPSAIEFDDKGNRRARIFYCNSSAPYQKGACENNHEMIRRIIPKGVDIGQYTQEDIDLMMSHINSYARKNLGDKSPYDAFAFAYGENVLKAFGLRKIEPDKIILKPKLLAKNAVSASGD